MMTIACAAEVGGNLTAVLVVALICITVICTSYFTNRYANATYKRDDDDDDDGMETSGIPRS